MADSSIQTGVRSFQTGVGSYQRAETHIMPKSAKKPGSQTRIPSPNLRREDLDLTAPRGTYLNILT